MGLLVLVAVLVLAFALGLVDLLLLDALGVLDAQVVADADLDAPGNVLDVMAVLDVLDAEKLVLLVVGLALVVVLIVQKIAIADVQAVIVAQTNAKEDVAVVVLDVLADVLVALDAEGTVDLLV